MIDTKAYKLELRHARKVRIRAAAAGRYLDALVRHMHRTRPAWLQLEIDRDPQMRLLPH